MHITLFNGAALLYDSDNQDSNIQRDLMTNENTKRRWLENIVDENRDLSYRRWASGRNEPATAQLLTETC
jgi:hypothetical protein